MCNFSYLHINIISKRFFTEQEMKTPAYAYECFANVK